MAESKKLNLMTTDQVAAYTGMSKSFFEKRRCKNNKKKPDHLKIGARVYYEPEAVDRWLASLRVEGMADDR